MVESRAYVFVVCGAKEHIDTLHFSLKSFRGKTTLPIIVVTDSQRNEIPILHDRVVDVETPSFMNHHQASIFLKTSLHKRLPQGGKYVYMDSDILAVGNHCDDIFDQYIPPIRFAPDHCKMPYFSPAAVNCGCQQRYDSLVGQIKQYVEQLDYYQFQDNPKIIHQREILKKRLVWVFKNKWEFLKAGTRGFFSWPVFYFDQDFKYNRKEKLWYNSDNEPIMAQVNWAKVAKKFGLRYNYFSMQVKDREGKPIWENRCNHLAHYIEEKFDTEILDKSWQHWNGGVFLFDDRSKDFLDLWHQSTLEIFKDSRWKTRDQGTLIATAWKLGLQNQPTLDVKWNFICDYHNALFGYRAEDGTVTSDQKIFVKPEFAHVYHHFGDQTWDFWNWISKGI